MSKSQSAGRRPPSGGTEHIEVVHRVGSPSGSVPFTRGGPLLISTQPDWSSLEERHAPLTDLAWDDLDAGQQRTRMRKVFGDYSYRNLKIRCKLGDQDVGKTVPFRMNREQQYLHDIAEQQLKETGRVRIILLKGRQWGGSTYTEGWFYWETTKREGCNTFIFSHEEKSTRTLYEMVTPELHSASSAPTLLDEQARPLGFHLRPPPYRAAVYGRR